MKVIEHINQSKNPLFSCEIVPPPRGRSISDIIEVVEFLRPYNPAWIDVTAHAAGAFYNEIEGGKIERKVYKKRPGTMGICGVIQNRFKIDTVAHLLCMGFTQEETEDALIELNYLGVENVLALRGDRPNYTKPISPERKINNYALDLVKQIHEVKQGQFLNESETCHPLNYCVGVAAYPEKHFEAPNLKADIQRLKEKVEAGAEYAVTQMFFDNQKYYDFVSECREEGINIPIIPGLKILKSVNQLTSLPKNFYIDFPIELTDEILTNPTHVKEIGKRWAKQQAQSLIDFGAPAVHFYIMNDAKTVSEVIKDLSL